MGKIIQGLIQNSMSTNYIEITTILSRIYVSTPHSADVERCISANNLLKTAKRSCLLIATENKYLHVYFNMPSLQNWDPRSAMKLWLADKIRRDRSNIIDKKATKSPYYKGIFENAENESDSIDDKHVDLKRKF